MLIIKGDLKSIDLPAKEKYISCLICTARAGVELKALLIDLAAQTLNKNSFEIIILNNGEADLQGLIDGFSGLMAVRYFQDKLMGIMLGALRNKTIEHSQGEYFLFLDDDTRIPQKNFLEKTLELWQHSPVDMIIPYGRALGEVKGAGYQYLDPYSFATRCCFYKRSVVEKAGGFFDELGAYEDIDLAIRCHLWGIKILRTDQLHYAHPGLFFATLQKPVAIGQSIFKLRKHYPWYIWLLIYLNALRFLPLGLLPTIKNRQWFKISLGVLIAPFMRQEYNYRV